MNKFKFFIFIQAKYQTVFLVFADDQECSKSHISRMYHSSGPYLLAVIWHLKLLGASLSKARLVTKRQKQFPD